MGKHVVRFGAKNDGPKTVEFENEDDAKDFAEIVGGRVVKPAQAKTTPAKPATTGNSGTAKG